MTDIAFQGKRMKELSIHIDSGPDRDTTILIHGYAKDKTFVERNIVIPKVRK